MMMVSKDVFRIVYFQGHPEYDINSLLKEYKREISRFLDKDRKDYPPFPNHYFSTQVQALFNEHRSQVLKALSNNSTAPEFPESTVADLLHNTWHDTAEAIINNWIGKVYLARSVKI